MFEATVLDRSLTGVTHRFVAWYLFGVSGCLSPILYSTVNTIVKDDSEERALIMVTTSTFNNYYSSDSTDFVRDR